MKENEQKTTNKKNTKTTEQKTTSKKNTKTTGQKATNKKNTKTTEQKTTSKKNTKATEKKPTTKKETKVTQNKPETKKATTKSETTKKAAAAVKKTGNNKSTNKKETKVEEKAAGEKRLTEKKKEKKPNKFIQIIKKKWLVQGTTTTLLVLAIISVFIAITFGLHKLELSPIDLSQGQVYTLSDEVKERVKKQDITQPVNVYFIGFSEDEPNISLAKQFKDINEKINVETINATERKDIVDKYGIQEGSQGIIVECGEKSKVLTPNDLMTYDSTSGETINIADEKLATSIISVTSAKIPKVYFLNGYSLYSLERNMTYLSMFLSNEITEVDSFDILTTGKVPDDCDALVITTPNKDFEEETTKAIQEYISKGGNILWFNAAVTEKQNLPNVNKILAQYGVNPFEIGIIRETDAKKTVTVDSVAQPNIIIPETISSTITRNLYDSTVMFINATKINVVENDKLEELKVEQKTLLQASEKAYFRNNISNTAATKAEGEAEGPFTVGAEFDKKVQEAKEDEGKKEIVSKLVIYGENNFLTDIPLSQTSATPVITFEKNRYVAVDSIAYLADREEDISARKSIGTVTYTATEQQNMIIMAVIFSIPVLIIIIGIVVWQIRRRKK